MVKKIREVIIRYVNKEYRKLLLLNNLMEVNGRYLRCSMKRNKSEKRF